MSEHDYSELRAELAHEATMISAHYTTNPYGPLFLRVVSTIDTLTARVAELETSIESWAEKSHYWHGEAMRLQQQLREAEQNNGLQKIEIEHRGRLPESCEKALREAEARAVPYDALKLLRELRNAAYSRPSCQYALVDRCQCLACVSDRVDALLTPAQPVAVPGEVIRYVKAVDAFNAAVRPKGYWGHPTQLKAASPVAVELWESRKALDALITPAQPAEGE